MLDEIVQKLRWRVKRTHPKIKGRALEQEVERRLVQRSETGRSSAIGKPPQRERAEPPLRRAREAKRGTRTPFENGKMTDVPASAIDQVISSSAHVSAVDFVSKLQKPSLGAIAVTDYLSRPRHHRIVKCECVKSVVIGANTGLRLIVRPMKDTAAGTIMTAASDFALGCFYLGNLATNYGSSTSGNLLKPAQHPWLGLPLNTTYGNTSWPFMPLNGIASVKCAPGGYDVPPRIQVYYPGLDNRVSSANQVDPSGTTLQDFDCSYDSTMLAINSDMPSTYDCGTYLGGGTAPMTKSATYAFATLLPNVCSNGAQEFCNTQHQGGVQNTLSWLGQTGFNCPVIDVVATGQASVNVEIRIMWYMATPIPDSLLHGGFGAPGIREAYDRHQAISSMMRGIGNDEADAYQHAADVLVENPHPMTNHTTLAGLKSIASGLTSGHHGLDIVKGLLSEGKDALEKVAAPAGNASHSRWGSLFKAIESHIPQAVGFVEKYAPKAAEIAAGAILV